MIRVFAPATVANLGPGFDCLGVAVTGLGDVIEAEKMPNGIELELEVGNCPLSGSTGDSPLSDDPMKNTAGIAATEALKRLGNPGGIRMKLIKGLPNGSGLGSSAASAAAAAGAVNELYGRRLSPAAMVACTLEAEAAVSGGRFADNVAPAVLGGAVLVRSLDPLDLVPLGTLPNIKIVLVTPRIQVLTREARAALPSHVALPDLVRHTADASGLVAAFLTGDDDLLVRALRDNLIESVRARFIPGYAAVRTAAFEAGAEAFSISGSGPTVFAVTRHETAGQRIAEAMTAAFNAAGIEAEARIAAMDPLGVRLI